MDCKNITDSLYAYHLGFLEPDQQLEIKKHLKECKRCFNRYQEIGDFTEFLESFPDEIQPGIALEERLIKDVGKKERHSAKSRRIRYPKLKPFSLSVAAIILIGIGFYFLFISSQNRVLDGTLCVEGLGAKGGVLKSNDSLPLGQLLKTSAGQSARIKLRDGSVLKMMPSTALTLNNDRLFNLEEGELDCQVAKGGGFVISMPGAELKTLGTEFSARLSTNRKEINTSQNKLLSFLASAMIKVTVTSGRVALTTSYDSEKIDEEIKAGETIVRNATSPVPSEVPTEIRLLIARLGDTDEIVRNRAFLSLTCFGSIILPFLDETGLVNNSLQQAYIDQLRERFSIPTLVWESQVSPSGLALHRPVVSDEQLYTAQGNMLYAIDTLQGTVIWTLYQADGFNSVPLLHNNLLYIGTLGGHFLAIDARTGKIIWQQTGLGNIQATPVIQANRIYLVSSMQGGRSAGLYALDRATGNIQWHFFTSGMIVYAQPIILDNQLVVFGDWDGRLYALKAENGESVWEYQTNGKIVTAVLGDEGLIYLGSGDGQFYALDSQTAQKQWSFQADSEIIESPVQAGKIIYWGTRHKIYALDIKQHMVLWTYNRERSVVGTISVDEDKIYLGTDSGQVVALDAGTGQELWHYNSSASEPMNYSIASAPAIFKNTVYVMIRSNNGINKVCALKLK